MSIINKPEIYIRTNIKDDNICSCCGEKSKERLYRNPWDCKDFGLSRECIMLNMKDAYNENYKEGWDLDCDGKYWKAEYLKTLEEDEEDEVEGETVTFIHPCKKFDAIRACKEPIIYVIQESETDEEE